MFDWYDDPSRVTSTPRQTGGTHGGKGPVSKVEGSMRAMDEFEAMLSRRRDQ